MSEEIEQVRQKARAIAARIDSDAQFKAQILDDPEATLVAAGLPSEVVPIFLVEQHLVDVVGYEVGSCLFTRCAADSHIIYAQ